MRNILDKTKRIFENALYRKIIIAAFLVFVISLTAFLTINVFLFYHKNIEPLDVPLYYEFKVNTLSHNYDESLIYDDISEQYLSYGVSYGVDVSEWQGEIDWEKVAATGISFAMIRCGFRQTVGSEVKEDAVFRKNIEGATKAGLKVGVYFFGTAKTKEEALEEAEFTVNLIKDYNLTYPVVYDIETFNDGRLKNVSYSTITDNVLTFTETVASYGYETMVYSYHNALSYMLDTGKFDGKLIWLAHYADKTNYKGNYNMWQYTSSGRVEGIKTNVDLNVSYFTYVDTPEEVVENPLRVEPPVVNITPTKDTVKTKSSTTIRTSATTDIPNRLGSIPRNTKVDRLGVGENYSLIEYNGLRGYVLNKDIYVVG